LTVLLGLCVVLSLCGIVYVAAATLAVLRLTRRASPSQTGRPRVSILKPLHGDEPDLFENLRSFVEQDYAGEVEILLGIQRADDPAGIVAEALIAAFPDRSIRLVCDERRWGTNRKVSNLANLAERASGEVIVLADSDIRVARDYLERLLAELQQPGVGVVTCPYHGLPRGGLAARLVALGIDTNFLPGVAMSVGLKVGHPCLGSTIALRRTTLDAIGGFRAVANTLADDHEIGRAVRHQGLALRMTPFSVQHVCAQVSLGSALAQETRWSRTIRQIEPAGHLGAVTTHPLPFALLALSLSPGAATLGLALVALAGRLLLCRTAEKAFALPPHPYWLLPLRDVLSFLVYAGSFLGRSVQWRGFTFEVARDGALMPRRMATHSRSDAR
jgi:ceramide glucosyltransferase